MTSFDKEDDQRDKEGAGEEGGISTSSVLLPSFWNMKSCGRPATASKYKAMDQAMSEGGCLFRCGCMTSAMRKQGTTR